MKAQLSRRFEMKYLAQVTVCLGIEISRDRAKLILHLRQITYMRSILARYAMKNCKPVTTPMHSHLVSKHLAAPASSPPTSKKNPYREAVGSLMFVMVCARPDIAFAVCRLAQYSENPLPIQVLGGLST